jgi:predicted oxidoreductase
MKQITIGRGEVTGSEIALGCMRMNALSAKDAAAVVQGALEAGVNYFDHADVYGGGKSEEVFAQAIGMNASVRAKIILQSKCGIGKGQYDFSREHILEAVQGILKRLKAEYLDVLLLHRPDTLMEPQEVAEAFEVLHRNGQVRSFGVSNFNPLQIELLRRAVPYRLVIDQLQLSLTETGMIDSGINVNTHFDGSVDRDGSILEYCRLNDITIQAWSPLLHGWFEGPFLGSEKFPALNAAIDVVAKAHAVPAVAVAIAWILRHPARIQPVVGSMNPGRIRDICKASGVQLTRKEWYDLYTAGGKKLP